jgi:hypothetical protein
MILHCFCFLFEPLPPATVSHQSDQGCIAEGSSACYVIDLVLQRILQIFWALPTRCRIAEQWAAVALPLGRIRVW